MASTAATWSRSRLRLSELVGKLAGCEVGDGRRVVGLHRVHRDPVAARRGPELNDLVAGSTLAAREGFVALLGHSSAVLWERHSSPVVGKSLCRFGRPAHRLILLGERPTEEVGRPSLCADRGIR